MTQEVDGNDAVSLATELTVAWLANPNTRASADDVPAFLEKMHKAVTALAVEAAPAADEPPAPEHVPAVGVRKSLSSPDHIISMIDGKPYKMLRRHLTTNGLTPKEYRKRYNLKDDYPMVAATYAAKRRELAKSFGLGRKAGQKIAKAGPATSPAPSKPTRGRAAKRETDMA